MKLREFILFRLINKQTQSTGIVGILSIRRGTSCATFSGTSRKSKLVPHPRSHNGCIGHRKSIPQHIRLDWKH